MGCWVLGLQALPSCAFPLSIWMLQRLLAACLWLLFPFLSRRQCSLSAVSSDLQSPGGCWCGFPSNGIIRLCSGGTKYLLGLVSSWGWLFPKGISEDGTEEGVKLEMWSPWVIRRVNIRQFEVETHSVTYPGSVKTPFFHSRDGSASPCCDLKVITYSVNVWQSNSKVKPAW